MRQVLIIILVMATMASCIKNERTSSRTQAGNGILYETLMDTNVKYDSILATRLGSDDYGMKSYVMAFLKRGPNRDQDSVTAAEIQKAHLKNIGRMADEGKVVLAGPFSDDGDIRGIYIFNVATVEEAAELTATDPAIQAGRLVMELHPWYGTAILPILAPMSQRLEKSSWVR